MKTAPISNSRPDRPDFTVELLSGRRGVTKFDVEAVIAACPAPVVSSTTFPSGSFVAGRLLFRQWQDVVDGVVFFWSRHLAGDHPLIPKMRSVDAISRSDHKELNRRLKAIFAAHAWDLLDGESVRRCRKRINDILDEIGKLKGSLSGKNRLVVVDAMVDKRQVLEAERLRLVTMLSEFRAAIQCIFSWLKGRKENRLEVPDDVQIFKLGDRLSFVKIEHLMARECRRLDEGLPIYVHRQQILKQIRSDQVMVLIGETGSGKSTQLVQFLADSGLADEGSIICTQPRKIAATSLAKRVQEESSDCYADNSVACYQTYSSVQSFNHKVVFMTDYCLLQHCMNDSNLASISHVVVDEAHERSLNTDLLLALVKKLLNKRVDLRLIIMSATADANKLSNYFGCVSFHVRGRNFPVDIRYVPNVSAEFLSSTVLSNCQSSCASYVSDAVKMVTEIHKSEEDGAVLAFLTSQMEVEWACENFRNPTAVALPLHGKLSHEEQVRVFQNYHGKRKVIFATNVAETSLTIADVRYVVDSGMVKDSRFEPNNGMNVLKVCMTSQSSAMQRAGRAGRTGPGKCFRLYSEVDFQSMPCHQEPEIRKVHLGIAVLRILSLGIESVQDFNFIDAPSPEAIDMAIRNLIHLGAVIIKDGVLELTDMGHYLVKLGIEPRLGKLILDSFHHGLGKEGVVLAAVMANSSSIFCRVGTNEDKLKSDCLKVPFCHPDGDLFTLLSVYKEWEFEHHESKNEWCWRNSINAKSMRRCRETVHELEHCLQYELRVIVPSYWTWKPHVTTTHDRLLKKLILSSHIENVAVYSGYGRLGYEVALTGQHVQLHPSCSLLIYGQNPSWVVFGEILSISNQYLVCVTAIDHESLLTLQPPPPYDVSELESRKMQMDVITGVGNNLLKRLCGKSNTNLHFLISCVRAEFMDSRIGIDADFDMREIRVFASLKDIEKVSGFINDALERERKWLQDECTEKCLFRGVPDFSPSVALFGAGAEIKHLELDSRYLSVEVSHPNAHVLCDKELLVAVDKCASGIANFYKYGSTGQEVEDLEKWGKITYLSPELAEKAVKKLNEVELQGSFLKVLPSKTSFGSDQKTFPFPAVNAKVCWPRRQSKGVAIIRCDLQELGLLVEEFSNMPIGGKFVHCEVGRKYNDCVILSGLDKEIIEPELANVLRSATKRTIFDVSLLRGEAVSQPNAVACAGALRREIAPFMPNNSTHGNFRVQVFPPEPKDYLMKAAIFFDGSLHLEAAKALQHIEGKVLPGCQPWQKIQCHQLFHSSISCPAPVYFFIEKQLDSLLKSFKDQKGTSYSLDKNANGSYRVKISSNATKTVAELRKPLERLMKGKILTHASLTPSVLKLLFSREGIILMKRVQQETGTYILHDRQNQNVKVFGPTNAVDMAEQKLVQSLLLLHESKQFEIHLRGGNRPHILMKEVIQKFGPDLHGLMEKVPGVDFVLNTRRQILSVNGSKEMKQKVEKIILDLAESLGGQATDFLDREATCPICLCEIEDAYRLEGCGHEFCRTCLIDQCESLIKSHEGFPLCCAHEGCKSQILLVDLKTLLSSDKLEELFRASLGNFVTSSAGAYRFCPSPDCPAVYQAVNPDSALEQPPFSCRACFVETCRKCHLEYHPSVSCERYREFKDDPDTSLAEWRKGKENVKNCPVCSFTIEKGEGCNHIECKCGKHICWVCLECFKASDECYGHLRDVHQTII